MLRCEDCEFFKRLPDGSPHLACDPYSTIKEPECLAKWELRQLQIIADAHRATLDMHRRFAPLQQKLFKHLEKEIDETEDADRWKYDPSDDASDEDDDPFHV